MNGILFKKSRKKSKICKEWRKLTIINGEEKFKSCDVIDIRHNGKVIGSLDVIGNMIHFWNNNGKEIKCEYAGSMYIIDVCDKME